MGLQSWAQLRDFLEIPFFIWICSSFQVIRSFYIHHFTKSLQPHSKKGTLLYGSVNWSSDAKSKWKICDSSLDSLIPNYMFFLPGQLPHTLFQGEISDSSSIAQAVPIKSYKVIILLTQLPGSHDIQQPSGLSQTVTCLSWGIYSIQGWSKEFELPSTLRCLTSLLLNETEDFLSSADSGERIIPEMSI